MPFDLGALRAQTQETLIAFLTAELNLGSTLVQSALLAEDQDHVDHYAQAKRDATVAADAVRRFIKRVKDQQVRAELAKRLSELDRFLLSTLTR